MIYLLLFKRAIENKAQLWYLKKNLIYVIDNIQTIHLYLIRLYLNNLHV